MTEKEEVAKGSGGTALIVLGVVLILVGIVLTLSGIGLAFGPPVILVGALVIWWGKRTVPS